MGWGRGGVGRMSGTGWGQCHPVPQRERLGREEESQQVRVELGRDGGIAALDRAARGWLGRDGGADSVRREAGAATHPVQIEVAGANRSGEANMWVRRTIAAIH